MEYESQLDKAINYDNEYHKDKFGNWEDPFMYELKGKVAKDNIFLPYKFNPEAKTFEFGCGIGQITAWVKNKHALDINKNLYPSLQEKGFTMYNTEEDIPDNYFDEVVISQVLEHLPDAIDKVKMFNKKLKMGGLLRIALPRAYYNIKSIEGMNTSNDGHYYSWGFPEINYLLNQCGFKAVYNGVYYRKGIDRFASLAKISYPLYKLSVNVLGRLYNDFDIVIVGEKIK
jgi:SAM-dependent methyltransferase